MTETAKGSPERLPAKPAIKCQVFAPLCVLLLLIGFCVFSCKGGKVKSGIRNSLPPAQRQVVDSLQKARDIDSADYVALFKNKTNIWLYKMLQNKQVRWEDFKLIGFGGKGGLKKYQYLADSTPNREYTGLLIWSAEISSMLDSVSSIAGNKNTMQALPDKPQNGVWGSHWIDSVRLSVLGYAYISGKRNPDTLLWMINLNDGLFRTYKYH